MQEYLFAIKMIVASITSVKEPPKIVVCPRCRRLSPKGPRKQPNPIFPSVRQQKEVLNENT